MAEPNQRDEDKDFRAPAGLIEVLGALEKETVLIPAAVDEAVLDQAGRRLAGIRMRRARRRRNTRWLALAASLVLVGSLIQTLFNPFGLKRLAREDLNHDGRVDILDALQLAREIKLGKALPMRLDLNGDGKVDEEDVKIIVKRAVSLEKGGRS